MTKFELFLQMGFEHIADIRGYDHILFILALCGVYLLYQWKHVLILVTAFTIGHSVTLALATLKILIIPSSIIEFLIPVTIVLTALLNIFRRSVQFSKRMHAIKYATAMFFGLIHGLGFSNYLRSMLGQEQSIAKPLLAFNLGLELGQIAVVLVILLVAQLVVGLLKAPQREWNLVISGSAFGIATILMLERIGPLL